MKTLTSILVAGAIAATSVVVTASGASAGGWNNGGWDGPGNKHHRRPVVYQQHNNYHHNDGNVGGALVAGAVLGLAFGAIASQNYAEPYPPEPVYLPPPRPNFAAVDAHIAWCSQQYRSYNAERDTFVDFQGIERACVTPYE